MAHDPLTPEHLEGIKEAMKGLDRVDEIILRAKQAGIDIGGREEVSTQLRAKLSGIKSAFFPGE